MAGFYPVPSTRTSGLLMQNRILQQINFDQIEIQRLQQQISTGRRIAAPSEDSPAALRGQTLQRLLELKAQAQINLRTGQSYLDASDTALGHVTKLLTDIRAVAMEAGSDTSDAAMRQVAAAEVERAIENLLNTGNSSFRGRYLFTGSRSGQPPFAADGTRILYTGNEGALNSFVDLELPYATNGTGAEVFGAFSPEVHATVDLDPILTTNTPLADLYGGQGATLGSIRISDGVTESIIDLSAAATIGDVAALIAASPPAGRTVTATVTATGLTVDIDDGGGGNFTIKEALGGTTAADLQIFSPTGTGTLPVVGGDLNPRLRLTTPIANVQTSLPLDLASGLAIILDGQTFVVDTSAVQTVEELLNAINATTDGVLAQIDTTGDRLVVRSRLSGVDFAIGENGGTTATQLGLRSLTVDTPLTDLNYGRGVSDYAGTDFRIRRKDGVELLIDVSSAATIGDVLNLINTHPSNLNPLTRVDARLAAFGNGIELFDGNTAGAGQLQVVREFGSQSAWELGLIPFNTDTATGVSSGSGDSLTGTDVNPLEVAGVFNALIRLKDSLANFDHEDLARAVALLDEAFERVNLARGELGARNRTLDTIKSQLEDEDVLLKSNLADEIEVNLADAISQLASRQAAYEASLRLAAQMFQTSLLNFL